MKVLIIEDDKSIKENLSVILESNDFQTESVTSQAEMKISLDKGHRYDLYLVDIMLPDGNGFDVCSYIRERTTSPIIFLTCCDDESSITKGLDLGADDYIIKPFRASELLSRIRAIYRRTSIKEDTVVKHFGELSINLKERSVMHQDKEISLTPIEFQLLEKLIENNGRIIKRESLLSHMWDDYGNFVENNTLTVTVSRLKAKLGKDVATGRSYIETIYGIGYRWMGGEDH